MPTLSSCLGSAACEGDHSPRHQRDVIRVVDVGPLTSTGRGSATTVAWPAIDAGSNQQWLVHPRGAHPPTKRESPEATGYRFHAQDGGLRVTERGGPPVQLPPRARVTVAPGPGSGASSISGPAVGRWSERLRRFSCRRCCGAALLIDTYGCCIGHLSPAAHLERSVRDDDFW